MGTRERGGEQWTSALSGAGVVDLRGTCENCPGNEISEAGVGLEVVGASVSLGDVLDSEVIRVGVGVGRRGSHPTR